MRAAAALLLLLLLLPAACGFQPLYGTTRYGAGTSPALQSVAVSPIPDRLGQLVRNHLVDRLTPQGVPERPLYRLDIALTVLEEPQAITRTDEATRTSLTVTAAYSLYDYRSNLALHRTRTRATTAYNVLRADFGNVIAERDAISRVSVQLAENIRTELATWFARGLVPTPQ